MMGASWQADAFFVAFRLPNTFRRLFGEGAFSAGFVPLYSQRLQSGRRSRGEAFLRRSAGGLPADADPVHGRSSMLIMQPFVCGDLRAGTASSSRSATFLTRITFPYLLLISLVSLFSGILNSIARFTAAAFAPALLNLAMLSALIFVRVGGETTATALAIAVTIGGVLQLGLLLIAACKRAGIVLKLARAAADAGRPPVRPRRHPGDARRRRLSDQRVHRHLLPRPHRHRRASASSTMPTA